MVHKERDKKKKSSAKNKRDSEGGETTQSQKLKDRPQKAGLGWYLVQYHEK